MDVKLRKLSKNDDLEGLKVLQNVTKENYDESPFDIKLNDKWYEIFLNLAKKEANEKFCIGYWITLNDKIVGYGEIRPGKDELNGNVGIILEEKYQNNGLGYEAMKLLLEKAKKDFNMKKILITTNPENIGMRKVCEKLGAKLTDIDEKCKYWI